MADRKQTIDGAAWAVPPVLRDVTGFLLSRVAARLREVSRARLAELGLQPRDVGLLLVLRDEGAMPQQTLGARVGMDRTTTMQLVTSLEAAGIVRREPHPGDKRAYLMRLTPAGLQAVEAAERHVREAQLEVLDALTPSEVKALNELLRKIMGASADRA
jgi:MarR family transcriptional regulator, lower aerobic nicotinate degradation pathway regulator